MIVRSGKFYPIHQNVYFDFTDELPGSIIQSFKQDLKTPLTTYFEMNAAENINVREAANLK